MSKFVPVFVRSANNYDMDAVSRETGLLCDDESLAVQSGKEEADINTIVRRFGLTGELPGDLKMPQSGDFTNVPDFHGAMNLIASTQAEFLRVPAEIRARFNNDPQRLMSFLDDDGNRVEAEKLGFLKPKVDVAPPLEVRVVNPPKGDVAA
ncbi:MAG: internal scaffolding protein [Microviridae sp.]|nr:MAG: internal scaffolding protein [Microviridae sp.]